MQSAQQIPALMAPAACAACCSKGICMDTFCHALLWEFDISWMRKFGRPFRVWASTVEELVWRKTRTSDVSSRQSIRLYSKVFQWKRHANPFPIPLSPNPGKYDNGLCFVHAITFTPYEPSKSNLVTRVIKSVILNYSPSHQGTKLFESGFLSQVYLYSRQCNTEVI